jgi:hypothetical protein
MVHVRQSFVLSLLVLLFQLTTIIFCDHGLTTGVIAFTTVSKATGKIQLPTGPPQQPQRRQRQLRSHFPQENHELVNSSRSLLHFVDALLSRDISNVSRIPSKDLILDRIKNEHASDYRTAVLSPLALESSSPTDTRDVQRASSPSKMTSIPYEWIYSYPKEKRRRLAVQSLQPVLNATEIAVIQSAAEKIWNRQQQHHDDSEDVVVSTTNSRFTYQFKGNWELHVADFAKLQDRTAINVINNLLIERLYPWVREIFLDSSATTKSTASAVATSPPQRLFVYDALMIRYNASASDTNMAGQPLHRDLGLVSVNIMLNDNFEGGGTYFDNQNTNDGEMDENNNLKEQQRIIIPLKPSGGLGCCVAHSSNERHAGAGTTRGVRDILVIFLSLQELVPQLLNSIRMRKHI